MGAPLRNLGRASRTAGAATSDLPQPPSTPKCVLAFRARVLLLPLALFVVGSPAGHGGYLARRGGRRILSGTVRASVLEEAEGGHDAGTRRRRISLPCERFVSGAFARERTSDESARWLWDAWDAGL
ncbi:hypothetical protein MRX96_022511 [Rhipicephalus microplus]